MRLGDSGGARLRPVSASASIRAIASEMTSGRDSARLLIAVANRGSMRSRIDDAHAIANLWSLRSRIDSSGLRGKGRDLRERFIENDELQDLFAHPLFAVTPRIDERIDAWSGELATSRC